MKPEDKLKRQADMAYRTYKKEDYLRWLRKRDTFKKQPQEKPPTQADHAISQALMVWANDGGETNEQGLIIREKNHE